MNNQAKLKLEKIKKLKLPEKVRATADKIEKGLSSADEATQKKAEDALNKLYDQIKAVAAKKREEKTEKEVNEKTIVPQNADIAAPEAKKELTKKATDADDIIDKALKSDPELSGFGKSDKRRDAGRKAQPAGRRVSRKGWKNQYGKSDGGRVYYEGRENRTDRKSPSFKSGYPYLAKGGKIHPMDDEDGTFYVNHYKTVGDQMSSVDEREYKSKASAMTYAMMKSNFLKVGESIFVMNDDGDVLYTSIGTKKMAMGGKFAWQDAQVGDSARVIVENKMGTIVVAYGRRFHLKFPDGTEKTYSAEELEFYPDEEFAKGGYMAKGGMIAYADGNYDNRVGTFNSMLDAKKFAKANKWRYETITFEDESGNNILVSKDDTFEDVDWLFSNQYAKGGYMAEGENYEYVNTFKRFDSNVPVPQEDFEKLVNAYHKQLSGDKLAVSKYKVLKLKMGNYLGHKTVEEMEAYIEKTHNAHKMAKGGMMDNGVDYVELINLIKSADNPRNLPIYYNSDSNVVNIGGVGYDKGELVKKFNARAGQSLEIKNLFYQANQYPQETKNRIESMNVGIEVEIGKGYGNETFVKYIKMGKGGYMAEGGKITKGSVVLPYGMDGYGEFIVDKVFKNKSGETSYTGKFKKSGETREFILHSKDKVVGTMKNGVYYVEPIKIFIKNLDGKIVYTTKSVNKAADYLSSHDRDNLTMETEDGEVIFANGEYTPYGGETESEPLEMADGGVIGSGKNGYVAFFKEKRIEVYADSKYGAQKTAAKYFNAKRESDVNVVLAEVDGKPYIQSTSFATGGYVSKRDIEAITIVNPNKSNPKNNYLTFRSGEFLNGLNQFAKGGKLTDNYTYIKRSDIFAVYYKDKAKKYNSIMESKPKNGFWVSKKALIREGGKTPSGPKAPFDAYEVFNEFSELNYKVWDKLKIESGSQIYSSDSLQKKLAVEYPNSGIDAKFKNLKAVEKKKVAQIMTDENEHSLRNYLTLRGYLGQKEYDEYASIFEPKRRYVLNPANFKNYTADKVKVGSVLTTNTGVKVKVVEYNSQYGVKVLRLDATEADKPSQFIKLSKFDGFEKMAEGGKIGFEALSKKVASRYAGKKVQPKYQSEYGKTYNAEEAKEVGDKVAAKVYRIQQGKMAKGGELEKGIATEMKEHGMSREEATKTAQDHLKEDAKYYTKMAKIGLKNGGKINLPHELDRYFTKPKGTIEVEISKLIPIRARKSGIENAEVYMKKAYDGEMAKRKPIEIYKTRNKKYRVNDGNSTFAVAKKNGWETIYATVVSNPNVKARVEKSTFTIAKEIRKEGESWADAVQRVKNMRK